MTIRLEILKSTSTVNELAANVTSGMLRETFAQVGVVVEAHVQYDEETGHSLGWGTVSFERPEDAVEAMGFDGVAMVGVAMVVEIGDGREWNESLEGKPRGGGAGPVRTITLWWIGGCAVWWAQWQQVSWLTVVSAALVDLEAALCGGHSGSR